MPRARPRNVGRRTVGVTLGVALALAACDRESPLDTVADPTADAGIWRADAERIAGALPRRVASFVPTEGVDPFYTSYGTGPVFGASCAYADGDRQIVVRVESGNIRSRARAALDLPIAASDSAFVAHQAKVRAYPAVQRWSSGGRVGEVTFLVARRYLVRVRLVPATNESEVRNLAETIDLGPLEGLALDGVTP
jgi:hypothetical protein